MSVPRLSTLPVVAERSRIGDLVVNGRNIVCLPIPNASIDFKNKPSKLKGDNPG